MFVTSKERILCWAPGSVLERMKPWANIPVLANNSLPSLLWALLINNHKTIWHWSSLTLCQAPNCSRPWRQRAQVVFLACPQHALFTPTGHSHESSNFVPAEEEKLIFLESQRGRTLFFFFHSTSQRSFGRLYKNKFKEKRSSAKFKQNFSAAGFTRSRASHTVIDHVSDSPAKWILLRGS